MNQSIEIGDRGVIAYKAVTHGAVDSEVVIELSPGVEVVSIITKTSAESLGLTVGGTAYAVIKAPNVIVAVDD